MGEKDKLGECNFIDFMSYEETEPETYLEQIPLSKCPRISGLNLYIDPFRYYEMRISNSKGEAVFDAYGENRFKLGDTEYSCTVEVIPYNTATPYCKVIPHTAYDEYFDITIKQLTEDPKPDVYTTTTVPHKTTTTTTTTTTKTTTTTTKATTTTTKATTTTTKAITTTTKAVTTTTTKATTTTTTTSASTTAQAMRMAGDANLDGKVTVADAVAILQYIANKDKYELTYEAKVAADCNNVGDGITAIDALAIKKFDAGIFRSLPVRT